MDCGCAGDGDDSRHPHLDELGEDHGLDVESAVYLDNLQPIRSIFLTQGVGSIPLARQSICRAPSPIADMRPSLACGITHRRQSCLPHLSARGLG
jgi:hypothetical protein